MLLALVVIVQVANAALLLLLPPPRPEIYRLDDVVQVLKGDSSAKALETMKVEVRSRAPQTSGIQAAQRFETPLDRGVQAAQRFETPLDRAAVEALAERLGVPTNHIQLETARSLPFIFRMTRRARESRGPIDGEPPPPQDRLFMPARPPPEQGFAAPPEIVGTVTGPGGRGLAVVGAGAGPRTVAFAGDPPLIAPFKVGLMQADGSWLVVQSREPFPTPWQQRILLWLAITASLCVPLAWIYARWLASPIRRFAEAADRLGGDPSASELEISGPAEVRMAGEAFNRMQERLQRYIENRTTLVGAVAHDLRTPLARMRFLLETPTEDLRLRLAREIEEMDAMVGATMAFVRDSTTKAVRVDLDLPSLLESLVDDAAEEGHQVRTGDLGDAVVHGDPIGLKRLFDNLIRNGVKFATEVTVELRREGGEAVVEVIDNGPGLPSHDLERVFEPFYRGEASRNRETGGMGLGLAVVRSIARAHGGDAVMINRPSGGLICRVRLPLRVSAKGL